MFDEIKRLQIPIIATKFGMKVSAAGFGPCPACGAHRRGSEDRRLPVGYGRYSWRCFVAGCDAAGDGLALAAVVLMGSQPKRGDRRAWGKLCELIEQSPLGIGKTNPKMIRMQPVEELPPPPRPQRADLIRLWRGATKTNSDDEVQKWLNGRCIDPTVVDKRNLARAIATDQPMPSWAKCRAVSWVDGYRLIIPAYNPRGRVTSFRARWVSTQPQKMKEVSAACGPRSAGGLVYCSDPKFLARGRSGTPQRIMFVEGGPDYLTAATKLNDWVVIGIWSGAWAVEFAHRIPDHSDVLIYPHHDESGLRYARGIYRSLKLRNIKISIKEKHDGS